MPEPTPAPKPESLWTTLKNLWPVVKRLGPAAVLGVVATVMPLVGSVGLISALALTNLAPWMRSHQTEAMALYLSGFAVLAGLALLPTYTQSLLGGYAFGIGVGSAAAVAGFAGGAMVGYEIALRASGDRVMKLMDEHPKWRIVRDALVGRQVGGGVAEVTPGFWRTLGMVALLRCPPTSPFAITNLVMASVKVPRVAFLLGTVIGMAPRTITFVLIGAGVKSFQDRHAAHKPMWLIAVSIAMVVAVIGIVWHIGNQALKKVAAVEPASAPKEPN